MSSAAPEQPERNGEADQESNAETNKRQGNMRHQTHNGTTPTTTYSKQQQIRNGEEDQENTEIQQT